MLNTCAFDTVKSNIKYELSYSKIGLLTWLLAKEEEAGSYDFIQKINVDLVYLGI